VLSANSALQRTSARHLLLFLCVRSGPKPLSFKTLDDAMNDFRLTWLIGDTLRHVSVAEFGRWDFSFESGGGITAECPWRLLRGGAICVSSEDHNQQYGLPAPVDAANEIAGQLAGRPVSQVTVADGSADLHVTFGSEYQLQIIPFSSGYESWEASSPDGFQLIAQGGGQLSGYKPHGRVV
jgi:hypothetical protein